MKRHRTAQQTEIATQLSLFESQDNNMAPSEELLEALQQLGSEASGESQEAYEHRRVVEMAEKLGWPPIRLEAIGRWHGVMIAEGMDAWHDFLGQETSSGTIGLLLLALHRRLDPLTHASINEETGLHRRPVEVISQVEEQLRRRMIHLAKALDWPRVSYWAANKVEVIGPGEDIWQKYFVYGSFGHVADAVGALERRVRGEPEGVKQTLQQSYDDEEG